MAARRRSAPRSHDAAVGKDLHQESIRPFQDGARQRVSVLCRSAATSAARCAFRRISAEFAPTSRPLISSPLAGTRRRASPLGRGRTYLAVVGPMARSVDDLVLALDIIAGPDEAADGRAYRLNLPPARRRETLDFRVLVIAEHPLLPTSAAVGASLDRLSKHLAAAGADVKRETPLLPDPEASARLYVKLLNAFLSAGMPDDQYQEVRSAAEKIPRRRPEPRRRTDARGAAQRSGIVPV